jgi:hypothetical protein
MQVPPIPSINARSARLSFDPAGFAWTRGVDATRKWCPDDLTHLSYCPSFALLEPVERVCYNQLFAMGICEQFILLEQLLLVPGMRSVLGRMSGTLTPALARALTYFIEEEDKHSATFRRLLVVSAPEAYARADFLIYRLTRVDRWLIRFYTSHLDLLICWVWLATLFEEKSIDFYRRYNAAPDCGEIDPLYRAVHRAHAMEEFRHFQMDHHFVELFWAPAPAWKRRLNAWLFLTIMQRFSTPVRTVGNMLDLLVRRFPRLESLRERLLREAATVSSDHCWQEASYGPRALRWTFEQFDRFPEMARLARLFPCYRPGTHTRAAR